MKQWTVRELLCLKNYLVRGKKKKEKYNSLFLFTVTSFILFQKNRGNWDLLNDFFWKKKNQPTSATLEQKYSVVGFDCNTILLTSDLALLTLKFLLSVLFVLKHPLDSFMLPVGRGWPNHRMNSLSPISSPPLPGEKVKKSDNNKRKTK